MKTTTFKKHGAMIRENLGHDYEHLHESIMLLLGELAALKDFCPLSDRNFVNDLLHTAHQISHLIDLSQMSLETYKPWEDL